MFGNECQTKKKFPLTREDAPTDAGHSTFSLVRGLTLVLVAVLGGVFGAIWLAERGGPMQQKVDAFVRRWDGLSKQPSSHSGQADTKIRITVTESAVAGTRPKAAEAQPAPIPKPVPARGLVALPSLQAVHWSSQPGRTRIDIELGTATLAQAGRLHNPERLYFDLRDGSPQNSSGRFGDKEFADSSETQLARIRMARSQSNTVRVVLDLKRPCDISYRLTSKPHPGLVVELSAPAASTSAHADSTKKSQN